MYFIILLGGVALFALGYFLGRFLEERSNVKAIEVALSSALEDERQELVKKAVDNLRK